VRAGILSAIIILTLASGIWAGIAFRQREVNMADISRLTMPSPLPTAAPYFAGWPNHLAKDYGRTGQPSLTAAEATKIRNVLAAIKPCQRTFLRYAFPKNSDFLPFVMFFEPPASDLSQFHPDPNMHPTLHVLEEGNADYKLWDGEVFATPYWESSDLYVDIKERGCSP
jgi:hypothetical protein